MKIRLNSTILHMSPHIIQGAVMLKTFNAISVKVTKMFRNCWLDLKGNEPRSLFHSPTATNSLQVSSESVGECYLCGVDSCSVAGTDATPQQAHFLQWRLIYHLHKESFSCKFRAFIIHGNNGITTYTHEWSIAVSHCYIRNTYLYFRYVREDLINCQMNTVHCE